MRTLVHGEEKTMKKITTLAVMLVFIMLITAPGSCRRTQEGETGPVEETIREEEAATDTYRTERMRMVRDQIAARGISDPLVLAAMRKVPRHEFVPPDLPIGTNKRGLLDLLSDKDIVYDYIRIRFSHVKHDTAVSITRGFHIKLIGESLCYGCDKG